MIYYVIVGLVVFFGFMAFTGAPYVPSRRKYIVEAFTALYPLSKEDHLVDIGSGDGIVLRTAESFGARATGYEINPFFVVISRFLSRRSSNVHVRLANLWKTDFPDDTTVVYTFGDRRDIGRMASKVEEQATRLRRSLYLISYAFDLEGAEPTNHVGAYYLYEIKPLRKHRP